MARIEFWGRSDPKFNEMGRVLKKTIELVKNTVSNRISQLRA